MSNKPSTEFHDIWMPIPGFSRYFVSWTGKVVSSVSGKQLVSKRKSGKHVDGYQRVLLYSDQKDGKRVNRTIHSIVMLAFRGPAPTGLPVVRHLDGNNQNNFLGNLVYGTTSENQLDSVNHKKHHNSIKTHCPQGHEYSKENVYLTIKQGNVWRQCKTCSDQRSSEIKRKNRNVK